MLILLFEQASPKAGRISVFGFWAGGFGSVAIATTPWLYKPTTFIIGGGAD